EEEEDDPRPERREPADDRAPADRHLAAIEEGHEADDERHDDEDDHPRGRRVEELELLLDLDGGLRLREESKPDRLDAEEEVGEMHHFALLPKSCARAVSETRSASTAQRR